MENETTENLLQQLFEHILQHKVIELEISTLYNVLFKCLKVRRNCLTALQYPTIPYMLLHTLNDWPGWKKLLQSQQKEAKASYEQFKEFVIFRVNYILNSDYQNAVYLLEKQSNEAKRMKTTNDCETQTDSSLKSSTTPFYLQVKGPARLLNTLLFTNNDDTVKDSVVMEEYQTDSNWNEILHTESLLNMPFVEVEFQSPHLHFKTTNATKFERFITLNLSSVTPPNIDNRGTIEKISIIDHSCTREAYTLKAFQSYCDKYIELLKQKDVHFVGHNTAQHKHNTIKTLLNNFVKDIERINKNSLATNTSVLFNLSEQVYFRNRSAKTSDNAVHFVEYVTPKINLSLYKFTGIEQGKLVPFDEETNHTITYRCTHCKANYKKLNMLYSHFQTVHIVEQSLVCLKCKSTVPFEDLMRDRWFHRCT